MSTPRIDFLISTLPVLFTPHRTDTASAYYTKEFAELLLGMYIGEIEYQTALVLSKNYKLTEGGHFHLRERFPLDWLHKKPLTRPKGARKTEWAAYLDALRWRDATLATPSPPATPSLEQTLGQAGET